MIAPQTFEIHLPIVVKRSGVIGAEIWPGLTDNIGADLEELNLSHVRTMLRWSDPEAQSGEVSPYVYVWDERFVRDYDWCRLRRIPLIVSIHDTPQFYRDESRSTAPPKPEYIDAFLNFVRAAMARFPDVYAWECWNEPEMYPGFDGYCGGFGIKQAGYYGQICGEFYDTVKAVDSSKIVVFGSLMGVPESVDFLRMALAAGAKCDVVGYHGYCLNWLDMQYSIDAINQTWPQLVDLAKKPVWMTETSCIVYDEANPKPANVDDNQVRWLDVLAGWKDRLFDVIIWYAAGDPIWRRAGLMEGRKNRPAWYKLAELNTKR
jgi:hypothetical protein